MVRIRLLACFFFAATAFAPTALRAHGDGHRNAGAKPAADATPPEQKPWGIAGDPKKVVRTIAIDMSDEMKYHPTLITVKQGQTVRFALRNKGKVLHEMVIGSLEELREHAALMKRFPDMEHGEPWMAHVQVGKSEDIVWRFNRAGEFHFACLIPGHFEAGMVGRIVVK